MEIISILAGIGIGWMLCRIYTMKSLFKLIRDEKNGRVQMSKTNEDGAYYKCLTCGHQQGEHINQKKRDKKSGLCNECPKCHSIGRDGMVFYPTSETYEKFNNALFGTNRKTEAVK